MKTKILAAHGAAIAFALLTLTASAQEKTVIKKGAKNTSSNTKEHTYLNVESDSVGDPVQRITTYRDGAVYKIRVVDEKITALTIDGKEIPAQDFAQYQPMVNKILEQVKQNQEQAEKDRAQAALDRQQADKDRAGAEIDRQQADKDREQADKNRELAELDRQQADKDRARAEIDRQQADKERENADKNRGLAALDIQQAVKDRAQAEKDRERAVLDRKQAERDRLQAEKDRKTAEEDRKMVSALMTDLVKEKVIESESDLYALELSENGLIVNDKKQTAELFQKLKAKYLKKAGMRFSFYNGGNTKRFSIQQDK